MIYLSCKFCRMSLNFDFYTAVLLCFTKYLGKVLNDFISCKL